MKVYLVYQKRVGYTLEERVCSNVFKAYGTVLRMIKNYVKGLNFPVLVKQEEQTEQTILWIEKIDGTEVFNFAWVIKEIEVDA